MHPAWTESEIRSVVGLFELLDRWNSSSNDQTAIALGILAQELRLPFERESLLLLFTAGYAAANSGFDHLVLQGALSGMSIRI